MAMLINDISSGFSVKVSSRSEGTQIFDMHIHNYHELYFLLDGSARHFVDNEIINTESGELVFIKKGYIHKTMYEMNSFSKRLLICFDDDFVGGHYRHITDELGEQKYLSISLASKIEIEKIINTIYAEYTNKESDYLEMCKLLLRQLLIMIHRQRCELTQKKLTDNEIIIQNASKYIADNYCEHLSLQALASKYAMSESHFSKTFKFYTGFGVSEYITIVRMRKAEELLKTKKLSITETAYACGFNDSNYFASVFKKYKGITPLRYAISSRKARN